MCSGNINNFISLPHSPPTGVPVLWQRWSVYSHVSHFLVSNVPSKFYLLLLLLLLLVFFSNFQFKNLAAFLLLCCTTPPQRFILEKKAQNGKIEKTQPTHTHTHTAAAERALQFNMFCETLAGAGKMEIEKDGNGETQRKRWDVNWKLNSQFNFTHQRPK